MRYLSVKNFDRFQHYKNRRPPWIKLYNDLLDDYEFSNLSDKNKFYVVACFLLASRYNNRIPCDSKWFARVSGAKSKVNFDELIKSGFLFDSTALASDKQDDTLERERERETEENADVDLGGDQWKQIRAKYKAPKGRTTWKTAKANWVKTIKRGVDPKELALAIAHYHQSTEHDNAQYRMGLQRLLDGNERWREFVDEPEVDDDGPRAVNAKDMEDLPG
jgi:hypothetical protein